MIEWSQIQFGSYSNRFRKPIQALLAINSPIVPSKIVILSLDELDTAWTGSETRDDPCVCPRTQQHREKRAFRPLQQHDQLWMRCNDSCRILRKKVALLLYRNKTEDLVKLLRKDTVRHMYVSMIWKWFAVLATTNLCLFLEIQRDIEDYIYSIFYLFTIVHNRDTIFNIILLKLTDSIFVHCLSDITPNYASGKVLISHVAHKVTNQTTNYTTFNITFCHSCKIMCLYVWMSFPPYEPAKRCIIRYTSS